MRNYGKKLPSWYHPLQSINRLPLSRGSVLNSGVTKDPHPKMCIITFYSESPWFIKQFVYVALHSPQADPVPATADFWAALIAPVSTVNICKVRVMLGHVGPHQLNMVHSAFPPPRQDAGAITAAVIPKRLLIKAVCQRTDPTSGIRFTVQNTFR